MKAKWTVLVVTMFASVFGLLGTPGKAAADAITIGKVTQQVTGKLQINGQGTFSVSGGTLVGTNMIVTDSNNNPVSTTVGINVNTEWSSISSTLPAGTYTVSATIITETIRGVMHTTQSQNTMPITIK
jgi:hypothetical protein